MDFPTVFVSNKNTFCNQKLALNPSIVYWTTPLVVVERFRVVIYDNLEIFTKMALEVTKI